jgi:antitoxin Phd
MYSYAMSTPASEEWDVPEEISVTDARPIIGELVDAAASGKVIHLTKHGRRIAALVPERSAAEVNEAFIATADRIIERNREMFDRLAEL